MVSTPIGVLVGLGVLFSTAIGALPLVELSPDSYQSESFKAKVELLDLSKVDKGQLHINSASGENFNRTHGKTYRVGNDETLWAIAAKLRQKDVSTEQAMLTIYKLNPEAFLDNNINQLKSGSELHFPLKSQLAGDDFAAAIAEVEQHHKRWQQTLTVELIDKKGAENRVGTVEKKSSFELDQNPALDFRTFQGESLKSIQDEKVDDIKNFELIEPDDGDLKIHFATMNEQIRTLQELLIVKDQQISRLTELGVDLPVKNDSAMLTQAAINPLNINGSITPSVNLIDQLLAKISYVVLLCFLLAAGLGYYLYRLINPSSKNVKIDSINFSDQQLFGVDEQKQDLIQSRYYGESVAVVSEKSDRPKLNLPDVSNVPGFETLDNEPGSSIGFYDNDEVNNKLNLARVYIDMGDTQGAQNVIEEILLEGSDEQVQQANKLLTRLD